MLGILGVGIEGNFFELGGDSISSMQLVAKARKAGLIITPRDVFEHQSVEGLAAVASVSGKRWGPWCRQWWRRQAAAEPDHALAAGTWRLD